MPSAPLKQCRKPGCKNVSKNSYCDEHSRQRKAVAKTKQRDYDKIRGTRTERGYDNRWLKESLYFRKDKVCIHCDKKGVAKMSQCTDHIIPVSGPKDPLFWNTDNWQPLCHECHSIKTAKEDGAFGNIKKV